MPLGGVVAEVAADLAAAQDALLRRGGGPPGRAHRGGWRPSTRRPRRRSDGFAVLPWDAVGVAGEAELAAERMQRALPAGGRRGARRGDDDEAGLLARGRPRRTDRRRRDRRVRPGRRAEPAVGLYLRDRPSRAVAGVGRTCVGRVPTLLFAILESEGGGTWYRPRASASWPSRSWPPPASSSGTWRSPGTWSASWSTGPAESTSIALDRRPSEPGRSSPRARRPSATWSTPEAVATSSRSRARVSSAPCAPRTSTGATSAPRSPSRPPSPVDGARRHRGRLLDAAHAASPSSPTTGPARRLELRYDQIDRARTVLVWGPEPQGRPTPGAGRSRPTGRAGPQAGSPASRRPSTPKDAAS